MPRPEPRGGGRGGGRGGPRRQDSGGPRLVCEIGRMPPPPRKLKCGGLVQATRSDVADLSCLPSHPRQTPARGARRPAHTARGRGCAWTANGSRAQRACCSASQHSSTSSGAPLAFPAAGAAAGQRAAGRGRGGPAGPGQPHHHRLHESPGRSCHRPGWLAAGFTRRSGEGKRGKGLRHPAISSLIGCLQ